MTSSASHRFESEVDDSVGGAASGTGLDETVTSFSWLWVKTAWDASRNTRNRNRLPPGRSSAHSEAGARPLRRTGRCSRSAPVGRRGGRRARWSRGAISPRVTRSTSAAIDFPSYTGSVIMPSVRAASRIASRVGLVRDAVDAGVVAVVQLDGVLAQLALDADQRSPCGGRSGRSGPGSRPASRTRRRRARGAAGRPARSAAKPATMPAWVLPVTEQTTIVSKKTPSSRSCSATS